MVPQIALVFAFSEFALMSGLMLHELKQPCQCGPFAMLLEWLYYTGVAIAQVHAFGIMLVYSLPRCMHHDVACVPKSGPGIA